RSTTTATFSTRSSASSRSPRIRHIPRMTSSSSTNTSASPRPARNRRDRTGSDSMDFQDLLLQQIINGLSLGAMYSLLALGFTMVYGIIELINFAHFNVFMVGSFFGLWVLKATGLIGQRSTLSGLPLIGVLLL